MGKGHAPRPSTLLGELEKPTRVKALPATCVKAQWGDPWKWEAPIMAPCGGQVQRMAMRVPQEGVIAGKCARCGHTYLAPES